MDGLAHTGAVCVYVRVCACVRMCMHVRQQHERGEGSPHQFTEEGPFPKAGNESNE